MRSPPASPSELQAHPGEARPRDKPGTRRELLGMRGRVSFPHSQKGAGVSPSPCWRALPSEGLGPGASPHLLSPWPLSLPPGPGQCLDVTNTLQAQCALLPGSSSLCSFTWIHMPSPLTGLPTGAGAAQDLGQERFSVASLALKEEREDLGFYSCLLLVWRGGGNQTFCLHF